MAQYDGSIRIVTKITTKDAEESLSSLEWQIKKSAKYIDELRSKMDALKDQKIPTNDYKDLQKKLSDAEKELSGLVEKQNEWEKMGITSGDSWDSLNEKVASASDKVDLIKSKMQKLTDDGKDFILGQDTAQYKAMERQIQYEEESIKKAGEHYQQLLQQTPEIQKQAAEEQRLAQIRSGAVVGNQRIIDTIERRRQLLQEIKDMEAAGIGAGYQQYDAAKQELAELNQKIKEYGNNIGSVREKYKKLSEVAKTSFGGLDQSMKKSGGMMSTLASRFKGLTLSLLIFNQISKAFNAMISGM